MRARKLRRWYAECPYGAIVARETDAGREGGASHKPYFIGIGAMRPPCVQSAFRPRSS